MSDYQCPSHSTHQPTDQREFAGCRECVVDQYSDSTRFFTQKHIHEEGDAITPFVSCFTYNPNDHSLTIDSTGEGIVLDSQRAFVGYWMEPSRGSLYWNQKNQSANWLAHDVGYETGSWSTAPGSTAFTSNLTGIQAAKLFKDDGHAFPVNPGDPHITNDLVAWPFMCACGNCARPGESTCLVCR